MLKPPDVIELRTAVAGWEAGTLATVLESALDSVLAEISDEDGRTLDVVTVPMDAALLIGDRVVPEHPGTCSNVPAPTGPASPRQG